MKRTTSTVSVSNLFICTAAVCVFFFFLFFLFTLKSYPENSEISIHKFYLGARFPEIVQYFEKKDYRSLELADKLVYIESLSRVSRAASALEKLEPLLVEQPSNPDVMAAAGVVYMSQGRLDKSKECIHRSLRIKPGTLSVILSLVSLLLEYREFNEARR